MKFDYSKVLLALLLALALSCLESCARKQPSRSDGKPAALPSTWPIPELALVDDAIRYDLAYFRKPGQYILDGEETFFYEKRWEVAFSTSKTFTEMVKHVENSIFPLGYGPMGHGSGNANVNWYTSKDKIMNVGLFYIKKENYYIFLVDIDKEEYR